MLEKIWQIFIITLISCVISEIVLRLHDYQPFSMQFYSIESTPKQCLLPNYQLGFALQPGTFDITINQHIQYECTHNADSNRITRFVPVQKYPKKRCSIDIHGCSFTYGMSVTDSANYPFLIQQQLPQHDIQNLACPGYGTIQALLKLKQQIKTNTTPDILLVNYAQFHDERNTLSASFRMGLHCGFANANSTIKPLFEKSRLPYMTQKGAIQFEYWSDLYKNWRFREQSSVINALQTSWEQYQISPAKERAVTLMIFKQIQVLCQQEGIQLGIALITKANRNIEVINFCKKNNISILDMSLDLPSEKYSHLPHDIHPNVLAHQHFAKEMIRFLEQDFELNTWIKKSH